VLPDDFKITTEMLWQGALVFALLDVVYVAAVAIAFFEYIFYWCVILTLAALGWRGRDFWRRRRSILTRGGISRRSVGWEWMCQQTLPERRVRWGLSVYNQSKEFDMNINKTLFGLGLSIALTAATLLFFGVIESGIAAVIGIVGIGLIGASGAGYAASKSKNGGR